VKHGLVRRVCDWPYSSFKHYVARGDLPPDWGGDGRRTPREFWRVTERANAWARREGAPLPTLQISAPGRWQEAIKAGNSVGK
jgi:hypothetical protein